LYFFSNFSLSGAGRGPLVRAALNASKNTGRKLKILVVEKNQFAYITLVDMIKVLWSKENLKLVLEDVRNLVLDEDEKFDIIVSELLGSLGDNELSPECLDGAQKHLKPHGISIPANSISYVQPVMENQVHKLIRDDPDPQNSSQINYLSYLNSVFFIDEPKELFKFEHPNWEEEIDNTRFGIVNFKAKIDCVLHGFAGYFTSKLYKDIEISISPFSHTKGKLKFSC
jgi:type II protein arginine methyltransferase